MTVLFFATVRMSPFCAAMGGQGRNPAPAANEATTRV